MLIDAEPSVRRLAGAVASGAVGWIAGIGDLGVVELQPGHRFCGATADEDHAIFIVKARNKACADVEGLLRAVDDPGDMLTADDVALDPELGRGEREFLRRRHGGRCCWGGGWIGGDEGELSGWHLDRFELLGVE